MLKPISKRGSTLVELCIVMAMTAIIDTMVVSFCVLISARVSRATTSDSIQSDLDLAVTALDIFLENTDSSDMRVSIDSADGGTGKLTVRNISQQPEHDFSLSLEGNIISGNTPGDIDSDEYNINIPVKKITGITFSLTRNEANTRTLIDMCVSFDSPVGVPTEFSSGEYHFYRCLYATTQEVTP